MSSVKKKTKKQPQVKPSHIEQMATKRQTQQILRHGCGTESVRIWRILGFSKNNERIIERIKETEANQ